jgi:genome maintenance exonuclease 1
MNFNHINVPDIDLQRITKEDGYRYYITKDGNKYPSVTTMLGHFSKKDIQKWRQSIGEENANRISSTAATRGTKFHSIVEKYLANEDMKIDNSVSLELFKSCVPYINNIDNIRLQEKYLYSDHLRLAGTVDCIADYQGKLSVIDFKTSSRQKREDQIESYFIQTAAYAIMFEECYNIPVSRLVIIMAVENDYPQIFKQKRDNFTKKLLVLRDTYERVTSELIS